MSFLDTITGLFTGDTFYPGNPEREKRFKELQGDCADFDAKIKQVVNESVANMKLLNEKLKSIYPPNVPIPQSVLPQKTIIEQIPFDEISPLFSTLFAIPIVSTALVIGGVYMLAKDDKTKAATLVGIIGIPIAVSGSFFIFGVLSAGLAPGVIGGGIKRAELQDMIHKAIEARKKIAQSFWINDHINDSIKSCLETFTTLNEVGVDVEMMIQVLSKKIEVMKNEIDQNAIQGTNDLLSRMDNSRKSWTNEDNN